MFETKLQLFNKTIFNHVHIPLSLVTLLFLCSYQYLLWQGKEEAMHMRFVSRNVFSLGLELRLSSSPIRLADLNMQIKSALLMM